MLAYLFDNERKVDLAPFALSLRFVPRGDLEAYHDTDDDDQEFKRDRDPVLLAQRLGYPLKDKARSPDWL